MRNMVIEHMPHSHQIGAEEHQRRSSMLARFRWFLGYFIVSTVDFTVTRRANLRRI
jgi:cardiolipin synthase A/B